MLGVGVGVGGGGWGGVGGGGVGGGARPLPPPPHFGLSGGTSDKKPTLPPLAQGLDPPLSYIRSSF